MNASRYISVLLLPLIGYDFHQLAALQIRRSNVRDISQANSFIAQVSIQGHRTLEPVWRHLTPIGDDVMQSDCGWEYVRELLCVVSTRSSWEDRGQGTCKF